jgi:hypothetical protein
MFLLFWKELTNKLLIERKSGKCNISYAMNWFVYPFYTGLPSTWFIGVALGPAFVGIIALGAAFLGILSCS